MSETNKVWKTKSRNERLAEFGAIAVFMGVFGEVVFDALPIECLGAFWAHWGIAGCNVAVLGGVGAELLFGRKALTAADALVREAIERAGKLEKEAADARERTAQLKKEMSGRRVSDEQAEKIAGFLADKPQLCLRLIRGADDPEVRRFGDDIAHVFRKSGWKVQFLAITPPGSFDGMHIPLYGPPNLPACDLVRAAISIAGIEFRGGTPPFTGGMMAASGDNVTDPCADIHLGSKLPPNLD